MNDYPSIFYTRLIQFRVAGGVEGAIEQEARDTLVITGLTQTKKHAPSYSLLGTI